MTRWSLRSVVIGLPLAIGLAGCAARPPSSVPPEQATRQGPGPLSLDGPSGLSVRWRNSLAEAQAEAARTGRLVFLELTIPGCQPCARLERETYPDAHVQQALMAYVPVRVDASADEALANRFDFTLSPDLLLLTSGGQILDRVSRFVSAPDLVAFLEAGRLALPQASRATIPWAPSFDAAQAQARRSGRPVFVFVWNYG